MRVRRFWRSRCVPFGEGADGAGQEASGISTSDGEVNSPEGWTWNERFSRWEYDYGDGYVWSAGARWCAWWTDGRSEVGERMFDSRERATTWVEKNTTPKLLQREGSW